MNKGRFHSIKFRRAMRKAAIVAEIFLAISCNLSEKNRPENDLKIIGGSASNGDPAVVAIYVSEASFFGSKPPRLICSGTLIAPNIVLTAAHCVDEAKKSNLIHDFTVYPGNDLRDPEKRGKGVSVWIIDYDHEFNSLNFDGGHDIAVLVLREDMDIQPIPYLDKPLTDDLLGKEARIVGFGSTRPILLAGTEVKRSARVKLKEINNKLIKAGCFVKNTHCGDSGGPLLMNIDGEERIVGVTSFGSRIGITPAAYTQVGKHKDFVGSWVQRYGTPLPRVRRLPPPNASGRPCQIRGAGHF